MSVRSGAILAAWFATCGATALVSCGGASPPRATTPGTTATLPPLPPASNDAYAHEGPLAASPIPEDADPELAPPDRPSHEQAVAAARAGDFVVAKRLFARLVLAYPSHAILVAQYNAVTGAMEHASAAAKTALEASPLRALPAPPAKYTLVKPAQVDDAVVPTLVKLSSKKNAIVDDEAWFAANGIHLPELFVPPARDLLFAPGAVSSASVVDVFTGFSYTEYQPSLRFAPASFPSYLPLSYGTMPLSRAIDSAPYTIAIYGGRVLAIFEKSGSLRALLDFERYTHPPANQHGNAVVGQATLTTPEGTRRGAITVPTDTITHELVFALARGGTLYVEHSFNGYAKEAKGQTAYISALDLATGALAWRSQPLVANGRNFVLVRGGVVCGYGFTAEPDFAFVLNATTGAVAQRLPVHSGPDYFVEKEGRIFVRTYDTDDVLTAR